MNSKNYWKRVAPCLLLLVALIIMMLDHYGGIGSFSLYLVANVVAVLAALYLAYQASSASYQKRS